MKYILSFVFLYFGASTLFAAENLLPNGNFESDGSRESSTLVDSIDHKAIEGWRCFTVGSPARKVSFTLVPGDKGGHALEMRLVDNPEGTVDGRIGFDIDAHRLETEGGETYRLTFKARLADKEPCAVMVSFAGHAADDSVVSSETEIFELGPKFENISLPDWTASTAVHSINIIFNLVTPGSGPQGTQPAERCGIIVDDVVLEKVN